MPALRGSDGRCQDHVARRTGQRRRQDDRFTTGSATFVDDIKLPRMLHVAILRSPHAHARVVRIDAEKARRLSGVAAVITGEDARRLTQPLPSLIPTPESVRTYC